MKSEIILAELQRLSKLSNGILTPEFVVENAKDKDNPIHNCFEWNNNKAANNFRLWQARHIINVSVQYINEHPNTPYKVFVSLKEDRKGEGGYRELMSVMNNENLRNHLLKDALEEMNIFILKYKELKELAEVISEINKALNKYTEQTINVHANA
jgi:hypothetical protein